MDFVDSNDSDNKGDPIENTNFHSNLPSAHSAASKSDFPGVLHLSSTWQWINQNVFHTKRAASLRQHRYEWTIHGGMRRYLYQWLICLSHCLETNPMWPGLFLEHTWVMKNNYLCKCVQLLKCFKPKKPTDLGIPCDFYASIHLDLWKSRWAISKVAMVLVHEPKKVLRQKIFQCFQALRHCLWSIVSWFFVVPIPIPSM